MTVHSVYQMIGHIFLGSPREFFQLLAEHHLYDEKKGSQQTYDVPRFFVEAMTTYFIEVRPNFVPDEGMSQLTRRFPGFWVITEQFFVNSKSTEDFRVRQTKSSFLKFISRLVDDPVQKRKDELRRKVNLLIPCPNDPMQVVNPQHHMIEAVQKALASGPTNYSAYEIRDAVVSRINAQRHARSTARASAYVRVHPSALYSADIEATRLKKFSKDKGWPEINDEVSTNIRFFTTST